MKTCMLATIAFVLLFASISFGQGTVLVVDPTVKAKESKMTAAEQKVFDRVALPKYKAKYADDLCTVEPETAGVIDGSFTQAGAKQRVVFFQVCQTGNGLGIVGLAIFENGKIVGTFGSDGGWSLDAGALPDINKNGLDEFTLSYGGGMHQGQGGVGVDVMEFSAGKPKALGWFQAEAFTEDDSSAWKVTAKPGPTPAYFKQKYKQTSDEKWRRVGGVTPLKLTKPYGKFEAVK